MREEELRAKMNNSMRGPPTRVLQKRHKRHHRRYLTWSNLECLMALHPSESHVEQNLLFTCDVHSRRWHSWISIVYFHFNKIYFNKEEIPHRHFWRRISAEHSPYQWNAMKTKMSRHRTHLGPTMPRTRSWSLLVSPSYFISLSFFPRTASLWNRLPRWYFPNDSSLTSSTLRSTSPHSSSLDALKAISFSKSLPRVVFGDCIVGTMHCYDWAWENSWVLSRWVLHGF